MVYQYVQTFFCLLLVVIDIFKEDQCNKKLVTWRIHVSSPLYGIGVHLTRYKDFIKFEYKELNGSIISNIRQQQKNT